MAHQWGSESQHSDSALEEKSSDLSTCLCGACSVHSLLLIHLQLSKKKSAVASPAFDTCRLPSDACDRCGVILKVNRDGGKKTLGHTGVWITH